MFSFPNRQFKRVSLLTLLVVILLVVLYYLLPGSFISALIFSFIYVVFQLYIHPKEYVVGHGKLIMRYLFRKKKEIPVSDMLQMDISKISYLEIGYLPQGFTTPTRLKIFVSELDMREMQEELTRMNPAVEIICS